MSQILDDDFSKLEYEGWQRVAGQYLDSWANLMLGRSSIASIIACRLTHKYFQEFY
jgi:hypothetical protein